MSHPLVLEIHARQWLRQLGESLHRPADLQTVPEKEFQRWRAQGLTHVWLMGVWPTGPLSRAVALAQPNLTELCNLHFGRFAPEDIAGSPYAIADYTVAPSLGGDAGLRHFRHELHRHGLQLLLDFIPNHTGLDHPWLRSHPERFKSYPNQTPGAFLSRGADGTRWIAHGKDPWFTPWTDTAQLDFRNPYTHSAMRDVLLSIADRCDGVRCDMAMLILNDIFASTWETQPFTAGEFWPAAISAVKSHHPQFLFLAEVYWGLEARLLEMGFDYAYDKEWYDQIVRSESGKMADHATRLGRNPRVARFLENHDEPPIASILPLGEHQDQARLLLDQRCMRLLYAPQLLGKRIKTPIQFARSIPEPPEPQIEALYAQLLADANR